MKNILSTCVNFYFLLSYKNFISSFKVPDSSSLLVNTTIGVVQGHFNEVGIREWKGIPYAQPPVGSLRWEYPIAPKSYGVKDDIYIANFNANGINIHLFEL